jgi:hypothetical protein
MPATAMPPALPHVWERAMPATALHPAPPHV